MSGAFLIGGNHWDERWVLSQDLQRGESVPVHTSRQPGGAVANMARAMQGVEIQLASVYGDTAPPVLGAHQTRVKHASSARYVSLENTNGEVLYGFADMAIYESHMTTAWYEQLGVPAAKSDALVLDCNGPLGALASIGSHPFLVALGVSPAKAGRLSAILGRLDLLFCNQAEARNLDLSRARRAVVTHGAAGVSLIEGGNVTARFPAPDWQPSSGNGLGDRLAGLTLAAVLQGDPLDQALPKALEALPC